VSTKGFLTDCSLSEIFQFIEKGKKTGLLKLCASSECRAAPLSTHYIWVHRGRIVAVANHSDQQGLVSLIAKHQGVNTRLVAKLAQSCPLGQPLGLCFKSRLILEAQQLKQLFKIQVLQQLCPLFQIKDGEFVFYQNVRIPTREMTGLGIPLAALNQYCSINIRSEVATSVS
jgi:hypothetical protein